jgi:large subunit ribosomal protein L15
MDLSNLRYSEGSRKNRKRVGRGPGSGKGKTSGRGHNGAGSRSGFKRRAWFEGGQMPLQRRIPKFGFHNPFRVEYAVVNVEQLEKFTDIELFDPEVMVEKGLIRDLKKPIKVLGRGDITRKVDVKAHKFSKTAAEKIAQAGGATTTL